MINVWQSTPVPRLHLSTVYHLPCIVYRVSCIILPVTLYDHWLTSFTLSIRNNIGNHLLFNQTGYQRPTRPSPRVSSLTLRYKNLKQGQPHHSPPLAHHLARLPTLPFKRGHYSPVSPPCLGVYCRSPLFSYSSLLLHC